MRSENKPVFIVGSYRSGTSVLTWCIGQHPNILPLPETHWIYRLAIDLDLLFKIGTANGRFSHLGALAWSRDDFYAAFGTAVDQFVVDTREPRLEFIRRLSFAKAGKKPPDAYGLSPDPQLVSAKNYQVVRSPSDPKRRWVDGTPENTFHMYSLSKLFPGAKFIHILRDPDSVARSLQHFSNAGSAGRDYSLGEAYTQWMRMTEHAVKGEHALSSEKVMRINYSDLIQSSEQTLRRCFDFLGEDFSEYCLYPLREKINSSKVPDQSSTTWFGRQRLGTSDSDVVREARRFYERIVEDYRDTRPVDEDLYRELEDAFDRLVNDVQGEAKKTLSLSRIVQYVRKP